MNPVRQGDRCPGMHGCRIRHYWNSDVLTSAEGAGADIVAAPKDARWGEEVKR